MVRFKNRWLLLSLEFPSSSSSSSSSSSIQPTTSLTPQSLSHLIRKTLTSNFGLAAVGALGGPLSIKYYSPKTGLAILRCARLGMEAIRATCTLLPLSLPSSSTPNHLTDTLDSPTTTEEKLRLLGRCNVLAVSGTIKKLQERIIKNDRRFIQVQAGKATKKVKRTRTRTRRKKGKETKGLSSMNVEGKGKQDKVEDCGQVACTEDVITSTSAVQ